MILAIGMLARRTGIKIPTIRYYESIGLLKKPVRSDGRQRRYGADDVSVLNFIRHARELGFSIDAIRELLALSTQPDRSCAGADDLARRHLADVNRRIAQLVSLRDELGQMLKACGHKRVGECRVLHALAHEDQWSSALR